jgi:tetratricopeptide (TPR) repeat protein/predicted Ser/Thr protein kinase
MVGQTISHYRIAERLGSGGMGVVYRAQDLRLERPVALKFLPEALTKDPSAMERLLREAKAASSLHHQNIRTIFSFDEYEGRQFIVMELLDGRPLDRVVADGPMAPALVLSMAAQVADALDVAHARGIVHRDIKPANLFLTGSGLLKVLDFGLAKTHHVAPATDSAIDGQATMLDLTMSGTTIGTASYMAPEQVLGESVDRRSDLFSFGAVLYEMATGRQAFCGPTLGAIFDAILNRPPLPLQLLQPDLPAELGAIISKALEKDPACRYQSAAKMRTDLESARQILEADSGADLGPRAAETRSRSRPAGGGRRWPAAAAGVTAAAVLALVAAGLWMGVPRATYYPCVVVGEFRSTIDEVPAKLVEFQVKRALSQVPEFVVYDQRGYELALKAAVPDETHDAASWKRWMPGRRTSRPAGPAVRVTADIGPSLGNIDVALSITTKARAEHRAMPYKGVNAFFDRGIDDIARLAIARFREDDHGAAAAGALQYRPARTLLSHHLDAVRIFWRAHDAWTRLDLGAERDLQRALEIDADFALARLTLGEIRIFQMRMKPAIDEIERARQTPDALTDAERLRSSALLARASLNAPDERVGLQRLIELEPTSKEYVFELGESYFHTADIDEASVQYERALRLEPDYATAHNHLGYCYSWSGDHRRAQEHLTRYLELDRSANAWDSLGDAYMHAGEYAKAAHAKQQALAQAPDLYFAVKRLIAIDILSGRLSEAARKVQAALGSAADALQRAEFYAARAYGELRAGRLNQAADACRAGLALIAPDSDDSPADELLWLQGQAALARHDTAAAARALARLHEMVAKGRISETNYRPVYKYWLHLAALVDAAEGRRTEAAARLGDLDHVRQKLGYWGTPYDQAFFLDEIGRVRESLGDAVRAERDYRDALAYNPHYALARVHLGMLLRSAGRAEEARRELAAFAAEWKDADPAVPELKQLAGLSADSGRPLRP